MDIAIEVQKISLGEDKLLFKPIRLLKGIYDEEKDIFIDEFENKYSNMNGNNPYDEKYFSNKCILEDLRQTYFNLEDNTKILGQFLEDSINIFYVGYYDGITGTIKTLEYSFADIEAEISSKEYGLDISNVKEEVIGFDFTENQRFVFDINSLNKLKKIKSIDQLETFIDELISTGEYIKNEINSNNSKDIVSADKFECNENNSVDAQQEIDIDFVWEKVTPYTILRIEEKDYSKEELLKKVRVLIDDIKKIYSDEILIKKQIDIILDAYNEIINVNNKNSKTKMKKSR